MEPWMPINTFIFKIVAKVCTASGMVPRGTKDDK